MTALVFDQAPLRVYWELTRACDLACRHCRADAVRERSREELTTEECERVLSALSRAEGQAPHVVFTGGDPLKRPDLVRLVSSGVARGLGVSVGPTATPSLSRDTVNALRAAGVSAMSLSVDGPSAAHHWLARNAGRWPFVASTTEAPHFRRVRLQTAPERGEAGGQAQRARGLGIRDGNGIMFIAANGEVTPSGFLPLSAGNVRNHDPLELYREADVFRALRSPERLEGRCGACQFRQICGGSRARAWAATGNVLAEDPLCAWQP